MMQATSGLGTNRASCVAPSSKAQWFTVPDPCAVQVGSITLSAIKRLAGTPVVVVTANSKQVRCCKCMQCARIPYMPTITCLPWPWLIPTM